MSVTRLPTQHRSRPHCANCGEDLPDLASMQCSVGEEEMGECKLLAIIFDVECSCGANWHMRKTVSDE